MESGESPEAVISALGLSRSCIYDWIEKYREGGMDALKAKPLEGRSRKLTGQQISKLCKIVTNRNPTQLSFEFALWTRAMIRELIRDEFGVKLSDTSVGRLERKMGLPPQKPLRRAYQRDPVKVEAWLEKGFPEIEKLAKKKARPFILGMRRVSAPIIIAEPPGHPWERHP